MNGNKTIVQRQAIGRLTRILLATTVLTGLATMAQAQDGTDNQDSSTELAPIVLEGATYETEGTNSYTTKEISVGDKDTRTLREVPQSTTVMTRERLDDGNFSSLDTVMRKTPGVVVLTNDDGRSSLYSRGFEYDTLYMNGLSTPVSSIYGTQPDMVVVDHIEILRGPSGLFGGAGEPAGAVNMRLKQASDEYKGSINTIMSSWDGKRIEGDVTGPLTKSGRVRGRLVGALSTKDSFIDTVDNKVGVIYGTIQADITDNTTATLSINHTRRDITPFNGLPTLSDGTLLDVPRSTYTGADWNNFENNVTQYIAELEHRFDDGGHAKISALYSKVDVNFLYAYAASAASPTGNVSATAGGITGGTRWLARDYQQDSFSLDAHISKPFEFFGIENNIIAGADYRGSDDSLRTATGLIAGAQNIYDWNSNVAKPTVNFGSPAETETDQYGIYGQWRIKPIDKLTLIGGGRFSWYDAQSGTSEVKVNGEFTPYAGVIYDLTDRLSAYASYTEIFQPQSVRDASGKILDPRTGEQYELGLKAEVTDDLNASLAWFDLTDKNRAVSNPSSVGDYLAGGEAHMRGIEFEINGEILPNWEAMAGYTYTDTQFKNTTRAAGSEFYTPEHMIQLFTKYTFDGSGTWTDGIFVGGGVKLFSSFKNISRTAAGGATTIEAPGYGVVDLQAGYKFNENLTASLSVNNVFDKKYYERVGGTSVFNFYGEPRNVVFKLNATF
ncbi:amino acid ABC transporter substrate-binding protein [Rhizobium wenxiniae]|uniref:Outer membrane receptor for ferric coprogen and ferric-rhodotorulic acid n=1 Tax=Rhizobium wenxiniae TaxID=1737357 RepID=A0A7W9Y840_9HYPH|nr:TonB-dependent siderophore receptor [Rhizobium wenxiniae]MBB6163741.1 outer membrane receptor for ferric coprogen and ferric-rhodotorulic acid [Rhizobium wenxiniae]GGG12751.1 amino acid ABC transporter substrate-binding protein [Rhizobium wenxiniae]